MGTKRTPALVFGGAITLVPDSTEDEILMAFVNQYDNKSDDDPSRQEEIKKAISHPANSTTDHPNLPNNDQSYHSN